MTFTTLALTGDRVLVKGTDGQGTQGETVLDGSEWAEVKANRDHHLAHDEFEAAVEEFFAPITEAAEKLNAGFVRPDTDESSFVVIEEGEEATPGRRPVVFKLSRDSIILRLLEEGGEDRLVWVNDELEVLAVLPGTAGVSEAEGRVDEPVDEPVDESVSEMAKG